MQSEMSPVSGYTAQGHFRTGTPPCCLRGTSQCCLILDVGLCDLVMYVLLILSIVSIAFILMTVY